MKTQIAALALAATLTACSGAGEDAVAIAPEAVVTPTAPACMNRQQLVALSNELQQGMTDFDEASHNATILAEIAAIIEPVFPDVAAVYVDASDAYVAVDEAANVRPMTTRALIEATDKLADAARLSLQAVKALGRTVTPADWC